MTISAISSKVALNTNIATFTKAEPAVKTPSSIIENSLALIGQQPQTLDPRASYPRNRSVQASTFGPSTISMSDLSVVTDSPETIPVDFSGATTYNIGARIRFSANGTKYEYTFKSGDTPIKIARQIKALFPEHSGTSENVVVSRLEVVKSSLKTYTPQ